MFDVENVVVLRKNVRKVLMHGLVQIEDGQNVVVGLPLMNYNQHYDLNLFPTNQLPWPIKREVCSLSISIERNLEFTS